MSKLLDVVSNGRGKVSVHGPRRTVPTLDAFGGTIGKATVEQPATVWDRVAALRPAGPIIPENAFTRKEYMERFQISHATARLELQRLIEQGVLGTAIGTGAIRPGARARMYWLT
jgi:hypothetical protein